MSEEKWHIGKTIDVSTIILFFGFMGGMFWGGLTAVDKLDDRVDHLEYRVQESEKALEQEHEYVRELFERIQNDLDYIRKRLDSGA